ncbi:Uncharacterised protein [Mycobacteroides abscessus subsp. abscessus]|nr:Uncharacterised protein [Mycobacteroides abscessus subsp. abscessus]
MQRRQRRSTRGVDTDGWADEAQAVRDSARGTQLSAADDTHSTVCVDFADGRPVFVGGDADETTGFRSVDCSGIEPGVFQRLPRDPHGYPLLRIHRYGLTLGDAVESGVESACVGDESAGIGNAAPAIQVRQRQQLVHWPATVTGERRDEFATVGQRIPECRRGVDPTRRLDRHSGDDDGVNVNGGHRWGEDAEAEFATSSSASASVCEFRKKWPPSNNVTSSASVC